VSGLGASGSLRTGSNPTGSQPLHLQAMSAARSVTHFVALVNLAACLAGCGEAVGYPAAVPPAHTQSFPTEPASPLPAGVDAMTGLLQRPMRPPAPAPHASQPPPSALAGCASTAPCETCTASSIADLGSLAPNYGAGVGPAYLSGQDSWYSSGQVAILMVDSRYSGPLLVRAFQLGDERNATVTLADFPSPDPSTGLPVIKQEPRVAVVPALHTTGGGLYLGAVAPTSFWRAWYGLLSTDSPGCFGLQVDGDVFTEFILFVVNPGTSPGG
jgi:hypothetical protein